jgi:hypothetical protein
MNPFYWKNVFIYALKIREKNTNDSTYGLAGNKAIDAKVQLIVKFD